MEENSTITKPVIVLMCLPDLLFIVSPHTDVKATKQDVSLHLLYDRDLLIHCSQDP